MDSTAIFLGIIMILLLVVIIYLILNPTYKVTHSGRRHHYMPHQVMPQFGPYWAHGGQTNSGLLY